jgi:glycosyltransferase involved in cell wall biosynthesis
MVLTVCRVGFVGGAERVALAAAEAAAADGRGAVLACPADGPLATQAQARGLRVRTAGISRGRPDGSLAGWPAALAAIRRSRYELAEIAREEGAGLIHAHHPIGAFQAGKASAELGLPLVLHVHETLPMPPQYRLFGPWLRRRCALFICVSQAGQAMVRRLGVEEGRIALVYNAVEERYLKDPVRAAELDAPGPHIGIFGVLEARKGHPDLIRACAALRAEMPGLKLWIVGALSYQSNHRYVSELKDLAQRLGLADALRFTGERADVPELMAGMDAVVLASCRHESLPTVLIEASALGRPVVATDVGGVVEIVDDNQTGLVVRSGRPELLATALRRVLTGDGPAFGAAAKVRARKRFSPDRFREELLRCYDNLERS